MTQSDKKEEKNKETQKAEPASEKEKKLNRKVADKLKFYGVVTVLSLLCAGFIWFLFKPDTPETVEGTAGINTTIPDAIAPETMADKQKAYELEEMKKRRQEKVRTLQDMAGGYLTPDTTDGLKPEEDVPKADAIRHDTPQLRFCHCRGRRTACRSQYDTCLRGRRPDSDHRGMTEVPVAGTAASGRCACTCQYSAIWYGAYRRAADGSHSKLHREWREYPAGGTNGLRYGRAGRTFRSEYRRTYRHERSRRQSRV